MKKVDLSVVICGRNEMFFAKTVSDVLKAIRGNTEIIAVFDGDWPNPPVDGDPRVTIIYNHEPAGQREATNQAVRISRAKYIMKLDAHCTMDEGFDVKMMEEMKDDYTMIPALYNLHAFDWVCIGNTQRSGKKFIERADQLPKGCGHTFYQGPTPEKCEKCGGNMERLLVFKPRLSRRSEFYRFDADLHFQYHGNRKNHKDAQGDVVETMSSQGSCFMLTRAKYLELNICDEAAAGKTGWGQQGVEVACKTWLSGGRLVTNKKTWYSHMFRTQGDDFGFPYALSGSEVDKTRSFSKDLWFHNKWDKQVRPLSWLIKKFEYPEDWSDPKNATLVAELQKEEDLFYAKHPEYNPDYIVYEEKPTRGIIYYTDNKLKLSIAHACKKNIKSMGLPITSASLKPMSDMGTNVVINMERGYRAYFTQILAALEASTADIVYFCEHDWLYHPSHFDFVPPRKDTFYYNWNWWRVRVADGHSVRYDTQLLPGVVAYRDILIDFYRKVLKRFEELVISEGSEGKAALLIGFEPGTSKRASIEGDWRVERFDSALPIIDLRHTSNLTASKWTQDAFRSPKNCKNWQESKEVPGWGIMSEVLKKLRIT